MQRSSHARSPLRADARLLDMAIRLKLLIRVPRTPRRWLVISAAALVLTLLGGTAWVLLPFWQLSSHFRNHPFRQPSRLYGLPVELLRGDPVSVRAIVDDLDREGYRKGPSKGYLPPGRYRVGKGTLEVHLRIFPTPSGPGGGQVLSLGVRGSRLERLALGGRAVERVGLEPPLLASYYGDDLEERRPVAVDEVPEELVRAILAAEDAGFFSHSGISIAGILRAAWVNLRGGEIRQGGSTLTQQLVKNLYLSQERTLGRKLREAILAVLVDARYSKRQILEAYLNEIYLGASNGVNLIGVGSASRAYFGKDASQLDLDEAATLAGMIRSPATLSPVDHPKAAQARRNAVLQRMAELGWIGRARLEAARARPVTAAPEPLVRRRAPYFADAVREEARERFGVEELRDRGYVLLSTLSRRDQEEAREALSWGLAALEKGWQKGVHGDGPLQGALLSVDPRTGGILSYVGGRDYAASQYDRVGQARRQAGSAFKPVVYSAAFDAGYLPSSFVEDEELVVDQSGRRWSPRNADGEYHGWVSARTALEESYNVATARLALAVGLPRIVAEARKMGITAPLEPVPALALGAFEVSPEELATVYTTLATGGERPELHGLRAVLDATGRPLAGRPVAAPERVLSPETAYLVTSVLQGVLERGTAAGVRAMGISDPLAGKTGTTNSRRDNWFAGYAPDRVTVVWVGYDDNSPTRMSGARAALPIWARFTGAVRPAGGFGGFDPPPGIVTALVDPETGELATDRCPEVVTEVFRRDDVPRVLCHLHRGYWADPVTQPDPRLEVPRRNPFHRWLEKVFGRRDRDRGDGGNGG